MKQLAAILFLSIMLFNLYGYRLVIHYLQSQSAAQLSAQIDKNDYDNASLISIKTPLSLPYYSNSEDYERVDGVIAIDGESYNYVMRRVFNDSLELLCLPNTAKAKLDKVEVEFSKSASGGADEQNTKKAIIVKNVLLECCESELLISSILPLRQTAVKTSTVSFHIPVIYLTVSTPPPNAMHTRA